MTLSDSIIHVVCLKCGDKYSSDYVNKLYSMVQRHITIRHRFTCFVDDPKGIDKKVYCVPLMRPVMLGWWNKLNFFKLKDERVLFLDLDIIILNNIDSLLEIGDDFAVLRCPNIRKHMFNTTVMSFNPSKCKLRIDKTEYFSDQEYIQDHLEGEKVFIEDERIVSYKYNIEHLGEEPRDMKIVYCHGEPKPHELEHDWVKENWR